VATLTFAYADQQAVLGPLSARPDPVAYDLCEEHAQRLSAPRGWEIIRLPGAGEAPPEPDTDDLMALADAVRAAGMTDEQGDDLTVGRADVREVAHKGHLRMLTDASVEPDPRGGPRRR